MKNLGNNISVKWHVPVCEETSDNMYYVPTGTVVFETGRVVKSVKGFWKINRHKLELYDYWIVIQANFFQCLNSSDQAVTAIVSKVEESIVFHIINIFLKRTGFQPLKKNASFSRSKRMAIGPAIDDTGIGYLHCDLGALQVSKSHAIVAATKTFSLVTSQD